MGKGASAWGRVFQAAWERDGDFVNVKNNVAVEICHKVATFTDAYLMQLCPSNARVAPVSLAFGERGCAFEGRGV
eukprot:1294592-Pyramimonas_sp.AAC.1